MQLPNWEGYFEACCLVWVREWITLRNKKLLAIEGANKTFGWHAYLMYNKSKTDSLFKHHFIRNSLLNVWLKYKRYLPEQRPLWIIPEEVIHSIVGNKGGNLLSYQNLLTFEGNPVWLKSEAELDQKYDWWSLSRKDPKYIKDQFIACCKFTQD